MAKEDSCDAGIGILTVLLGTYSVSSHRSVVGSDLARLADVALTQSMHADITVVEDLGKTQWSIRLFSEILRVLLDGGGLTTEVFFLSYAAVWPVTSNNRSLGAPESKLSTSFSLFI